MNVIIIDDTPAAITNLTEKLEKYDNVSVVATAVNGADGIDKVLTHRPELIFLDIEMPDMSGISVLERLNEEAGLKCKVVIYTAYNDYMLPAFRNLAFDFLLKPVDDAELATVMQRAFATPAPADSEAKEADTLRRNGGKLLFYTNSIDFRVVQIRDICAFSYDGTARVWTVIAAGCDRPLRLKRNVKKDALLKIDDNFIQVSQRHIININYLLEVRDNICHFYPPFDKIDDVKVARLFRRKLINRYSSL